MSLVPLQYIYLYSMYVLFIYNDIIVALLWVYDCWCHFIHSRIGTVFVVYG